MINRFRKRADRLQRMADEINTLRDENSRQKEYIRLLEREYGWTDAEKKRQNILWGRNADPA
jgi:hypothetical protein